MSPPPAPPEGRGLRQPDQRTCGAASVVVAEARLDPALAARTCADQAAFTRAVLARHRELTRWPPYPRAIGTPPWAVARALTAATGVRHRTRLLRWRRAARSAPLADGDVLFVGNRWLPRHVVLHLGSQRVYDPASGRVVWLLAEDLPGRVRLGRWTVPWFVVTPQGRRTPA